MKNKMGFSGIGMLIVVIATLLIAVVSAGVLMHTGQLVTQRTEVVGGVGKDKVSRAYQIVHAFGDRSIYQTATINTTLNYLFLKVALEPGSPEADMDYLVIQLIENNDLTSGASVYLRLKIDTVGYDGADYATGWADSASVNYVGAGYYTAKELRDPQNIWRSGQRFLGSGSIIQIAINLTAQGIQYTTQDTLLVRLEPKHGAVTYEILTAPDAFLNRYVDLC